MDIFGRISLDEAEQKRPYVRLIEGFDAGDLPLRTPKRFDFLYSADETAIESLPRSVNGFRYSIPPRLSDKAEPSSHATESDDATSSRASLDNCNPQSESLTALLDRSSVVKADLRQLSGTLKSERDLIDIVNRIDRLLLDYDDSASQKCTPGQGSQARSQRPIGNGGDKSSPSNGPGSQDYRAAKRQKTSDQRPSKSSIDESVKDEEAQDDGEDIGERLIFCILHCFDVNSTRPSCGARWKNIRDLIVHLRSHSIYYCSNCSHWFEGEGAREAYNGHFDDHEGNRVCIDVGCTNRKASEVCHRKQGGCKDLRFGRNDEKTHYRKWKSLFRRGRPNDAIPAWRDVVCRTNSTPTSDGFTGQNAAATASTSTDAGSIPDAGQLANIAPTGIAPPAAGGSQSLYFENVLMTIATLPNPSDNNHAAVIALREEVQKLKERNDAQRNDMAEQRATIEKQQTVIVQQQERIDLHDSALNNLKQLVEQGNDTIKRLTERLQAFEDHVAWRLRTGGDSEPVVDPQQLQNRDWE